VRRDRLAAEDRFKRSDNVVFSVSTDDERSRRSSKRRVQEQRRILRRTAMAFLLPAVLDSSKRAILGEYSTSLHQDARCR
jgi:hypothetical protein